MIGLLRRELLLATRAGSGTGLGLAFFLIIVLLSALATGRDPDALSATAPGTLWIGALLAGLLSLDRIFQADYEDGTLEALIGAPQTLTEIVLTKIIAHWLTTGLPLVLLSPLMALMLNLPGAAYGPMLISLAVGTVALSAIGAIGAALTLGIRRGGLLLSLLVMPLYIPSLIFGVRMITDAATGLPFLPALANLAGISLFALALAPFVTGTILRMNLR